MMILTCVKPRALVNLRTRTDRMSLRSVANLRGSMISVRQTRHVELWRGVVHVQAIEISGPGRSESTPSAGRAVEHPIIAGMKTKITEALGATSVVIVDAYGDHQHVSIDVISPQFEGKNKVQRQRAVYKAIWEEMQEKVHAVDAMTTQTPEEAGL
eukprot:CAMPEP_0114253196 /NCGR_PEP_ID=MMETSP0058-20121206/16256_1 /TAXON_ID=36894 /ORGANISM="Pyramimonas parkeae, CCMP726" /LENGTH=155 /DNA_ID=CAMNT_0001367211 /DNA_START=139 /DNA_END=606 /DNA_ORIENTATION=+